MRRQLRFGTVAAMWLLGVLVGAVDARAQIVHAPLRPEAGDTELALGFTINGAATDVNAAPACTSLALPCTHERSGSFGGFGIHADVTRKAGEHAGITVAGEVAGYGFDSALEPLTHRPSTDAVTVLMAGPTFRTRFGRPRGPRQQSDRLFCQVLVGVQNDAIFDTRPFIQIAAGADSRGPVGRAGGGVGTIRITAGYRVAPGAAYAAGGFWFFLGVVLGPHQP